MLESAGGPFHGISPLLSRLSPSERTPPGGTGSPRRLYGSRFLAPGKARCIRSIVEGYPVDADPDPLHRGVYARSRTSRRHLKSHPGWRTSANHTVCTRLSFCSESADLAVRRRWDCLSSIQRPLDPTIPAGTLPAIQQHCRDGAGTSVVLALNVMESRPEVSTDLGHELRSRVTGRPQTHSKRSSWPFTVLPRTRNKM